MNETQNCTAVKSSCNIFNPIMQFLGKLPETYTREDMLSVLRHFNAKRLTFHYTALDGKLKELKIPVYNERSAELILTDGERVDGSSLFKGVVDVEKSDLYVIPLYKTAFLNPFEEGSLDFMCRFVTSDGKPAAYTPDSILENAAAKFTETSGYELYSHPELEFYLIGINENKEYPNTPQRAYHQSAPFSKTTDILTEIADVLNSTVNAKVKYAHNEVGVLNNLESESEELRGKYAEQVEIEFSLAPSKDLGDIISLAKWIIRNIAYNYGFIATFVPKLEPDNAGSGMHFHNALYKNGHNVMLDREKGGLSEAAHILIGGLCKYAQTLTAFGNTVAASYLRLVPHQEAPTRVCWDFSNRSALIRVPLGWNGVSNLASVVNPQQTKKIDDSEGRATVEIRTPDGSCFPQYLMAGILVAVEWAFAHKDEALKLTENCRVNCDINSADFHRKLDELPASCVESGELLSKNRALYTECGIFTDKIIDYFVKLLFEENDRDLNGNLLTLGKNERLLRARSYMHRAIHRF